MALREAFASSRIGAPGLTLKQRTREQRDQPVGLVAIAAVVNDTDPVAVGVPGDAEVEAQRDH